MTNDPRDLKAELLETIFEKTNNPGSWREKEKESFETKIGNLRISLERGALGDRLAYSIWIWSPQGLVDRIYDDDLEDRVPKNGDFETYGDMIRYMHNGAKNLITLNRLSDALDTLKNSDVELG